MLEDVGGMLTTMGRLAQLHWEQVRLSAGSALRGLFVSALTWLAAGVATVVCVVAMVRGLAGGLAAWTGRPWLGELLAGLLGLMLLALLGRVLANARDVRALRKLRREYGPAAGVSGPPSPVSSSPRANP